MVVRCWLSFAVCKLLVGVRSSLIDDWCLLFVLCCLCSVVVVWCVVLGVGVLCLLVVVCSLYAVCWLLFVVC